METTQNLGFGSVSRRRRTVFTNVTIYRKVTEWALWLLAGLMPVFFLPWTTNVLEINKQSLLVLLTFVAFVSWFGSMVIEKRLSFRTGWLNVVPAAFFLTVFLSSILSLAGYQTWVGQVSQEYMSFLTIITLVVLFYVLMNTGAETAMQRRLFFALLLGSVVSGIISLLGLFGLPILPFAFAQTPGFNLIGTINGLASVMVIVTTLGLGLWLVARSGKDELFAPGSLGAVTRLLIILQVLLTLLTLLIVDFWVLWLLMIFGLLLLSVFAFIQQKDFSSPTRFSLPIFLLIISVLFLFLNTPLRVQYSGVVSPSYESDINVAKQTLGRGIGSLLVGSGPGTYAFDYSEFKEPAVSQSQFWNVKFDRAKSHLLTVLTTNGILGLAAWLVIFVWLAMKALGRLLRDRDHEEWRVTYVVFCAWATAVFLHVLYSSNITLSFLLWLLTGLLASQVMVNVKETDFSRSPKAGLAASFGFILVAVAVVGGLFITGQRYASEVAFVQAVRLDQSGAPTEEVINKLAQATSYNRLSDVYYRNLSTALLLRVRDVVQEINQAGGGTAVTEEQRQRLQTLVNASMNATTRTTVLEPYNVSNWAVRGAIYRELMPLINGAEDFAAAAFIRASELEPSNPAHYTNLARVYILAADRARALQRSENVELATQAVESEGQSLTSAEEILNKAISYKGNYAPAHYHLAAVYERQGRLDDAVARMAALRDFAPFDIGIGFQLSQLFIRQGEYDLAKIELERIIGINPNYSNARWYLASMYEIDGNRAAAIEQIKAVLELNLGNELVETRLSRLEAGQSTTSIPQPVEEGEENATEIEEGEITTEEGEEEE